MTAYVVHGLGLDVTKLCRVVSLLFCDCYFGGRKTSGPGLRPEVSAEGSQSSANVYELWNIHFSSSTRLDKVPRARISWHCKAKKGKLAERTAGATRKWLNMFIPLHSFQHCKPVLSVPSLMLQIAVVQLNPQSRRLIVQPNPVEENK